MEKEYIKLIKQKYPDLKIEIEEDNRNTEQMKQIFPYRLENETQEDLERMSNDLSTIFNFDIFTPISEQTTTLNDGNSQFLEDIRKNILEFITHHLPQQNEDDKKASVCNIILREKSNTAENLRHLFYLVGEHIQKYCLDTQGRNLVRQAQIRECFAEIKSSTLQEKYDLDVNKAQKYGGRATSKLNDKIREIYRQKIIQEPLFKNKNQSIKLRYIFNKLNIEERKKAKDEYIKKIISKIDKL